MPKINMSGHSQIQDKKPAGRETGGLAFVLRDSDCELIA